MHLYNNDKFATRIPIFSKQRTHFSAKYQFYNYIQ